MNSKLRERLPLLLGLGLPTLLVLWLLVFYYFLPALVVKPGYDFVYATGPRVQSVQVSDGKVSYNPCEDPRNMPPGGDCNERFYSVECYRYDTQQEESTPLSLKQAQGLSLDPSEKSPDGYKLETRNAEGFFMFPLYFGGSVSNRFKLTKGQFASKHIELKGNRYSNKFVGWVIE